MSLSSIIFWMSAGIFTMTFAVYSKVSTISKQLTEIGARLDGLEGAGAESPGTGE